MKKPCDGGTQSSEHALYGDDIGFGDLNTLDRILENDGK